jgi:DNA-binding CsgD family transcriptional regulator
MSILDGSRQTAIAADSRVTGGDDGGRPLAGPGAESPAPSALQLAAAMAATMDRLQQGTVLIDRAGAIHWQNNAAVAAMSTGSWVERDRRFVIKDAQAQRRLQAFLAATPGRRALREARLALGVDRSPQLPRVLLLVVPLEPVWPVRPSTSLFAVFIHDSQGQRRISAQVLTGLYGLTRPQADLVVRLFEGRSLAEAAGELDIEVHTARVELRTILAQCGARSQAELLQLLALGPRI